MHTPTQTLLATIIVAAATCTPAAAEDDIVVTATRTLTTTRALPADVTVVDVDTSLSQGRTTLSQALESTPGLGIVQSGGAGQQTSVFASGANSNHTLVLFDGLRLNDPSTPGSSFDAGQDQISALYRIEIVEGPMSAAFGSDAIGGVINLIPHRGGEGPLNARLAITTGSFDTLTTAAGVDGTLGAFRYAVTAEAYASEGYDLVPARIVTRTGDKDGAEMAAITAVFDFALSDDVNLDLLLRRREARADFDALAYEFVPPYREYRLDDPDLQIAKNSSIISRLGATWELSQTLSLRVTAGNVRQQREQHDGGQLTDGYEGERRFADLTLDWRADNVGAVEEVSIVAGLSAEREEINIAQGFGFAPPISFLTAEQAQDSAFLTLQGSIAPLSLTGALRVDDYEGFGAQTTWRVGATYDMGRARVYGAYGTSFRAPTLYERYASFGDPLLNPEHGQSWELGGDLRLPAFGRQDGLELGILYRQTTIEDLIDFGPSSSYENIDAAAIDAGEARMSVNLASWLTLRTGYVYTNARDEATGARLLRRPEHAWTLGVDVAQGPFSASASWRSVGRRTDIVYGDDSFSIGAADTPAYDLSRLSFTYAFAEGADAFVAIENAFDEKYEPVNGFAGAPQAITIGLRLQAGERTR